MVTRENRTIRLTWAKDDLFQRVCTLTAYHARTLCDDKGRSLFDRFALTEDERPFFEAHIAQAIAALIPHFRRLIPNSQSVEMQGDTCGIVFSAPVDDLLEDKFGRADLETVERHAADAVCSLIVAEWFLSVQVTDLWKVYLEKSTQAFEALPATLFRFYRPPLRQAFSVVSDPNEPAAKEYEIHIDAGRI